ncbi:hypothetical protein M9H77_02283 [Catharanthus roseus]|uniref:Uncharacterized protein n=1 Tax=Catharanthus roseus TaxID=4058 RepID=A0ACC0C8H0_CATRO|nr:hypothetical protein M9H77_02283 [Catharanthus roseus]
MLGSVTLDLNPVDRGRSTVGGLGPRWRGPPARIVQCGLVVFYPYGKLTNSTRARELTEHPSLMFSKSFSPFSDDLPSESAYLKSSISSQKNSVM